MGGGGGGDGVGRMSNYCRENITHVGKKSPLLMLLLVSQENQTPPQPFIGEVKLVAGKMLKTGKTTQNLPFASGVERGCPCMDCLDGLRFASWTTCVLIQLESL